MTATELAVVGAGPAGLVAAVTAAQAGVQVTLVDEYARPGGQYLKPGPESPPVSTAAQEGRTWLKALSQVKVDLRLESLVWSLKENRLALRGPGGPDWLEFQALIVATGARELVLPFPGWTLPGVMTLGGAQLLLKAHHVLPGQRVLLAGSGPLLLSVATELLRHGARVVAMLEASHLSRWPAHATAVWGNFDRLREGRHYLRNLFRAGVPYHFGWTAIRALGDQELEAVLIARLDKKGRPVAGTEQRVAVDTLCLGFGFVPNLELTQLAGCNHHFDPARGGWVPQVDDRLESSVSGLFIAGETAGVGGAAAAMVEGRIAGLAAAQRLGYISQDRLGREMAQLAGRRQRLQRFGTMLNTLFEPPAGFEAITTDETVICRCEEVTAGQIRAAVGRGIVEPDALKSWTRVGQGPCQGRTCGPLLARLIARQTGRSQAEAGCFHVRPPLKPVLLGDLSRDKPFPEDTVRPAEMDSVPAPVPPESSNRWQVAGPGPYATADVVIIGGGIIGAACAYYLSCTGLKVHLVEQNFPAGGTSRACDSLILVWDKTPGPELALGQAGAALWTELADTLPFDFEYARSGTVFLAENETGFEAGQAKAAALGRAGVRAELVDNPGLRSLEPELAPDLAGGIFFPDDAQVDARRATLALLAASQTQGQGEVTLHIGVAVTAIRRGPDGNGRICGVVTQAGEIATETVVCAAGVWSNRVARLVGLNLPLRPRQGQILVTAKVPGLIRHPLLEGGYVTTVQSASESLQAALVAELTAGDTLLLGSSRQFAGFDRSVSPAVMQAIARRAVRFLPSLAGVPVIRSYAGLRPWSPDHLPLIGPAASVPGFYLAAGHEGAGICLAPITGRLIARWVTDRTELPPVANAVSPSRLEL